MQKKTRNKLNLHKKVIAAAAAFFFYYYRTVIHLRAHLEKNLHIFFFTYIV